jgi:(1->4)-alpha-D-glucan 1-alpha-D-glucosylmutase
MAASSHHWDGGDPDRHVQHLLFQTLVGAWPLTPERAVAYLAKATKEAKLRTTWTEPDPAYDAARDDWAAAVLADGELMADVEAFVAPLVGPGRVTALAQRLLQLTAPGVPDTYQGDELWDLSLVDPDNRRPVDFELRRRLLAELDGLPTEALVARMDEGLPKLRIVRDALALRRRRPEAFGAGAAGGYCPLDFTGPADAHGVGFLRGDAVAVVVPRLVLGLAARGGWDGTAVSLPAGEWVDVITQHAWTVTNGDAVPVADLLGPFPVALLERS